jgi:hypothetical protein
MRAAALLATIVGLTAIGGSSAAPDPWKSLQRPLEIPRVAPGSACPVSSVARSVAWKSFGIAPGIGRGPAYPVLGGDTLEFQRPERFESRRWGGQKVFWFVLPRYRGPVLIRGRQLDGSYRVRFQDGDVPPAELRIAAGQSVYWSGQPGRSRGVPSYTRLRAPGCYGYQIDGTSFSRAIVFRAVRAR